MFNLFSLRFAGGFFSLMEFTKPAPYEYKPFTHKVYRSINRDIFGYIITIYFLFDGKGTYSFRTQKDALENAMFLQEIGVKTVTFFQQFVVTPDHFPEIWKEIEDYENVLKSNSNKEY